MEKVLSYKGIWEDCPYYDWDYEFANHYKFPACCKGEYPEEIAYMGNRPCEKCLEFLKK